MFKTFNKITTTLALAVTLSGIGLGFSGVKAEANTGFKLPYTAGTSLRTSQSCIDEIDGINCTHSGSSVQKYSVDFGCGVQNPDMLAIASGNVIESGNHGVYGEYVKIQHSGGFESLYAHLKSGTRIPVNTQVSRGQKIGNCGTTGRSTGNHLHLELRNPNQARSEGKNLNQTYRIRFEEISANGGQAKEPNSYTSQNSIASTPPPSAPTPSGNIARIKAFSNKNFCLDVVGNNKFQNAPIRLHSEGNCNGNNPAQRFILPNGMTVNSNTGQGQVKLLDDPSFCLDFNGENTKPRSSMNTVLAKCGDGKKSTDATQWVFYSNGLIKPKANPNLCLANYESKLINSNPTGIVDCNGKKDHIWLWE